MAGIYELKIFIAQEIALKGWVNTTEIKSWGDRNFFTSADVRARELAREGFMDAIDNTEAKKLGLIKPGNQSIRHYRAHKEEVKLSEVKVGQQAQYSFVV